MEDWPEAHLPMNSLTASRWVEVLSPRLEAFSSAFAYFCSAADKRDINLAECQPVASDKSFGR